MENINAKQTTIDNEHLKLLSIFHYIMGGMTLVISIGIGVYFFFILMFLKSSELSNKIARASQEIPIDIFNIIMTFTGIIVIFTVLIGVGQIVSGIFIKNRKVRWFSYLIAALNCLSIPFGAILGICTFIVLGRSSVQAVYDHPKE